MKINLSKRLAPFAVLVLALVLLNSSTSASAAGVFADASGYDHYSLASDDATVVLPQFPSALSYEINVVFLGINESRVDETTLLSSLPKWYAPLDGMYSGISYDINFSLSYNLIFRDEDDVVDYQEFLEQNSVEDIAPLFVQPEYPLARYISSTEVEDYLVAHIMDDATPTLVIIDTYSHDPSSHIPYYYNATYNEMDAGFEGWTINPLPWASTYQIAGGGETSRLLWLDLSAGPTVYHSYGTDPTGGVENIAPIWNYDISSNSQLTQDLVKYIAQATECRILPSTDAPAGYAYEEVKMEVLLVDLASSSFAFENRLNLDYIVSEYARVNPHIKWTYSVSDWNWQDNTAFKAALENSYNSVTDKRDPRALMDFFDQAYRVLFNQSTAQRLIIPIFLIMTPAGWQFDPDWGGFARLVQGRFAYIYGKQDEYNVNPEYVDQVTVPLSGLVVSGMDYFNVSAIFPDISSIDITLENLNSSASVYLLDDYEFNQYRQGLPFTDLFQQSLADISASSGSTTSSASLNIYGQYNFVIENSGSDALSLDVTFRVTSDHCVGYTWKIMHELGHALGLNHPHDGYSWGNYDHPDASRGVYLDWLWDMSYTQINYANQAPTISQMDLDTLQRESIPLYWADAIQKMTDITTFSKLSYGSVSSEITSKLIDAADLFAVSVSLYSNTTFLQNYNQSLTAVFEMWDAINAADTLLAGHLSPILTIGLVGLGVSCLVVISFVVLRRRQPHLEAQNISQ